jgi:hypothetical protein
MCLCLMMECELLYNFIAVENFALPLEKTIASLLPVSSLYSELEISFAAHVCLSAAP